MLSKVDSVGLPISVVSNQRLHTGSNQLLPQRKNPGTPAVGRQAFLCAGAANYHFRTNRESYSSCRTPDACGKLDTFGYCRENPLVTFLSG